MKIFATALLATFASAISLHTMEDDAASAVVEEVAKELLKDVDFSKFSDEEKDDFKREGKKMLRQKLEDGEDIEDIDWEVVKAEISEKKGRKADEFAQEEAEEDKPAKLSKEDFEALTDEEKEALKAALGDKKKGRKPRGEKPADEFAQEEAEEDKPAKLSKEDFEALTDEEKEALKAALGDKKKGRKPKGDKPADEFAQEEAEEDKPAKLSKEDFEALTDEEKEALKAALGDKKKGRKPKGDKPADEFAQEEAEEDKPAKKGRKPRGEKPADEFAQEEAEEDKPAKLSKEDFEALSEEEKEALKSALREAKEEFDALSDEEKEALKAVLGEKVKGRKPRGEKPADEFAQEEAEEDKPAKKGRKPRGEKPADEFAQEEAEEDKPQRLSKEDFEALSEEEKEALKAALGEKKGGRKGKKGPKGEKPEDVDVTAVEIALEAAM